MGIQNVPLNKSSYGSFWKRGIALMIDFLILEMGSFLCVFLFSLGMYIFFRIILKVDDITNIRPLIGIINQLFVITIFILMNFYFIFMPGRYGNTIGKMILGLKVVKIDYTLINYKIAILRWVGFLLSIATFGIGFLLAIFDPQKQALHDKIARTYVIKK